MCTQIKCLFAFWTPSTSSFLMSGKALARRFQRAQKRFANGDDSFVKLLAALVKYAADFLCSVKTYWRVRLPNFKPFVRNSPKRKLHMSRLYKVHLNSLILRLDKSFIYAQYPYNRDVMSTTQKRNVWWVIVNANHDSLHMSISNLTAIFPKYFHYHLQKIHVSEIIQLFTNRSGWSRM